MKYIVSLAVDSRVDMEVDATSFAEAKEKAITAFQTADTLPNQDIISVTPVNATDTNDNFIDY